MSRIARGTVFHLDISKDQLVSTIQNAGDHCSVMVKLKVALPGDNRGSAIKENSTFASVVVGVFNHKRFFTKIFTLNDFATKKFSFAQLNVRGIRGSYVGFVNLDLRIAVSCWIGIIDRNWGGLNLIKIEGLVTEGDNKYGEGYYEVEPLV